MRIAQIALLAQNDPPGVSGGVCRMIHQLADEMARQGHSVTVLARSDPAVGDEQRQHAALLEQVRQRASQFDILHFHMDQLHPPLRGLGTPAVTTLHGRLDLPDLVPLYPASPDTPLIPVSNAQRSRMPQLHWLRTIRPGLPRGLRSLRPRPAARPYLAFVGGLPSDQQLGRAIEIAARAGFPLRIATAGAVAERDFHERVGSLGRRGGFISWIGPIADAARAAFLGGARALLCPTEDPEPFDLAMVEAMACGTPVVAWPSGAAPEVIEQRVNGFLVESIEEAVAAVHAAPRLDRTRIRATFERRFSIERAAHDHLRLYRSLVGADSPPPPSLRLTA